MPAHLWIKHGFLCHRRFLCLTPEYTAIQCCSGQKAFVAHPLLTYWYHLPSPSIPLSSRFIFVTHPSSAPLINITIEYTFLRPILSFANRYTPVFINSYFFLEKKKKTRGRTNIFILILAFILSSLFSFFYYPWSFFSPTSLFFVVTLFFI